MRVRLWGVGLAVVVFCALLGSPAYGAPPGPTAVTVSGPGLVRPRTVVATEYPDLFKDLLAEVDWLATRTGNAPQPDAAKLGPKFQLVVRIGDADAQAYEVYPVAAGGPRVFRPAKQPKGSVAAAWFYGRVSMPETLRAAGVPLVMATLAGNPSATAGTGGQGGGTVIEGPLGAVSTPTTSTSVGQLMHEWQRGVLLIGGGALLLLLLLGGLSYLIRKP